MISRKDLHFMRDNYSFNALALLAIVFIFHLYSCTSDGQSPTQISISTAQVEKIDIIILESFPVQVNVIAQGFLPDGCTKIDEIVQERVENLFEVTITTVRDTEAICTLAIVTFEETVPLDVLNLEAGIYTVFVNEVSGTFELEVDNFPPEQP